MSPIRSTTSSKFSTASVKWKQFPKFRRLWSAEFFCPHLQRHFKKRCQRIKFLHLLILPEAQKVNAPDREKEMRKTHYIPVTADVPGVSDEKKALIRRVIRTALAMQGVDFPCEVDVLVTGDAGIHTINLEMRGVDRPTDVLSFPEFELTPGELPGAEDADPGTGLVPLGDMVISLEHVAAQAKEYGHANRRELAYLAVHSVLHLLGYDHMDEGEQKRQMRAREEAIMNEMGVPRG